jgi:hypothetical protein
VYTSCGFQSNLKVQNSLARAVTVDKEVSTNSRTLHTLNVMLHIDPTIKLSGMKKILLILFALISFQTFGQITVRGKIIDKQDGFEIPGVTILEKGTKNGTVSDIDGYFSLEVADKNSILEISFIGYTPQEIQIADTSFLLIKLKLECFIDFFDYNDIGIGISCGAMNAPIGGYGYLNFIVFKLLALHGEIDFQTDLSQNQKIEINFGTLHLFADCGYDGDLNLNYRSIDKNDFTFNSYKIEGRINFSHPRIFSDYSTLFLGYGLSEWSKPSTDYKNNSGFLVGFGTHIGKPLYLNINLKTVCWMDFWEFIGEIKWQYKNLEFSTNYNVIDSYNELNLKLGYIFNY